MGVTIACVNAHDYLGRGDEYVGKLRAACGRNELRVFTEADGLRGWWNKLQLFRPGAFPAGERVVYLDLDTVVVGDLGPLLDYRGPFAALRDFYRKWGLGSGVMAWEAGTCDDIWTEWDRLGRPELRGGDQSWIEYMRPDAVRLQNEVPGIVSYKVHCLNGVPKHSRLVCFHGSPRPHEVTLEFQ